MKLASKITMGLLASLSLTAAVAQTTPVKAPPPAGMHQGPGPGHKEVTRAEVLAKAAAHFDAADVNKDGVLTRDEHRAHRKEMRDQRGQRPGHPEHPRADGAPDQKGPPPPREGGLGPAPQR
jgi:hypothetical protein